MVNSAPSWPALPRVIPRLARDEVVLTIYPDRLLCPVSRLSSRKEVIQPQVPLRLPCYDLVPVTDLTFGRAESPRLRVLPASMT